ncbi:MAG: Calvin cycle protein CP12, partial [Cyanobacteria bacterium J06607_15]
GIVSISDILKKSNFVEKPKQLYIEDRLDVAREEARAVCAAKGATSPECAAAWDEVEELQAAAADKRQAEKKTSSLEAYCADNPDALECRIYED